MVEGIDWEDDNLLVEDVVKFGPSLDALIVVFNSFPDLLAVLSKDIQLLSCKARPKQLGKEVGGEYVDRVCDFQRQGRVFEYLKIELDNVIVQISIGVELFNIFRPKVYIFRLITVAPVDNVGFLHLSC